MSIFDAFASYTDSDALHPAERRCDACGSPESLCRCLVVVVEDNGSWRGPRRSSPMPRHQALRLVASVLEEGEAVAWIEEVPR